MKLFAIHKDGKLLDKDQSGRTIKVAYLKKGSANGVVTNLINNHLRYDLHLSDYRNKEEWDKVFEKEKVKYEVVEYTPK